MSVTDGNDALRVNYPSVEGAEYPWPLFRRMRDECPVFRYRDRPNLYAVTRYDDVKFVLSHPEIFSSFNSRDGLNGGDAFLGQPSTGGLVMNQSDGVVHRRARDLAALPFHPTKVRAYEPVIAEIADDLIDRFAVRGEVEFQEEFALVLPARLTCRLMGIPSEDEQWVRIWGSLEASGLSWMPEDFKNRQRANAARMLDYLNVTIAEKADKPQDDIISKVIEAQVARDGSFDLVECRAQVALLLAGGVVTTGHFMGLLMQHLLENRDVLQSVQADLSLLPKAIEEVLRIEGPTQWQPRRVLADTEIDGVKISAGSFVAVMLGSANRDERRFPSPETLDLSRANTREHLAFGFGPHTCLGAPLARLELRVAFERLLTRLQDIELSSGNDFSHIASPSFRGLNRLLLTFRTG